VMHNATGIPAKSALQVGEHLIVWSEYESSLFVFHTRSLELTQTVDVPAPVCKVILLGDSIICQLLDETLCRLHFDGRVGRIGSHALAYKDYSHVRSIDALGDALLIVKQNSLVLSSPSCDKQCELGFPASDGVLISATQALLWSANGNIYVFDGSFCTIQSHHEGPKAITARGRGVGSVRMVTEDKRLVEVAVVEQRPVFANRQIQGGRSTLTSSYLETGSNCFALGCSDGTARIIPLHSFYLSRGGLDATSFGEHGSAEVTAVLVVGSVLVTGLRTGRVKVWDKNSQNLLAEFRNHAYPISSLLIIHREQPHILAVAEDSSISIYTIRDCIKTRHVILPRRYVAVRSIHWATSEDNFLMIEYSDGLVRVWNLKTGCFEGEQAEGSNSLSDVLPLFTQKAVLESVQPAMLPLVNINVRELISSENGNTLQIIVSLLSHELFKEPGLEIREGYSLGICGAGGNHTFYNPSTELWNLSPVVTATIHLTLLSLLNAGKKLGDFEEKRFFFESSIGQVYCAEQKKHRIVLPSLSNLSKFWINPSSIY